MSTAADQSPLVEEFEHDPRYRISLREAWLCVAYWATFTLLMVAIAWGIAGNRNPEETTYIAGFPDWFFWTGVVVVAIFCLIPYLMIRFLFTEVDLEPHPAGQATAVGTSEEGRR